MKRPASTALSTAELVLTQRAAAYREEARDLSDPGPKHPYVAQVEQRAADLEAVAAWLKHLRSNASRRKKYPR